MVPVAGCHVVPPSVETSTPATIPPPVSAAVPLIVTLAPSPTLAPGAGELIVEVRDDGVGGARTDERTGLLGLYDRVAAMNGELHVDSPPGGGTTIAASIPVQLRRAPEA